MYKRQGGKDVEIDIRKTVEENAARYFEDAKWARRKIEGVEEAKKEKEKEMEKLPEEEINFRDIFPKERIHAAEAREERKPARKKWYEKFRWFFSSDGFLVIAGRSAEQNEIVIKKHTEDNDMVFHADIPGAAFVVVKSQGMDIPDETMKEAAEFAAANSKAWSKGLGNVDVFCVKGSQVSKSPPSGEHLQKGSFMIYGERIWYRDQELKLSIGIKIHREEEAAKVIAGPVMAVRKNSDYFVTIKPGFKKPLELARSIKNKILIKARPEDKFLIEKTPLEEIQNVIPAGMGEVFDYS